MLTHYSDEDLRRFFHVNMHEFVRVRALVFVYICVCVCVFVGVCARFNIRRCVCVYVLLP